MNVYQRILLNLIWGASYRWLLDNGGSPIWNETVKRVERLGGIPDV